LLPTEAGLSIILAGETFADSGLGAWISFYDWLRGPSGDVIGVRTWLEKPEIDRLRHVVRAGADLEFGDQSISIFLGHSHEVDEWSSSDQSLGTHRLMTNGTGTWALTFDVGDLSENEIEALSAG
jgi:hypothetical protein